MRWPERREVVWDSWVDSNCHHCLVTAVMLMSEQVLELFQGRFQAAPVCHQRMARGHALAFLSESVLSIYTHQRPPQKMAGRSLSSTECWWQVWGVIPRSLLTTGHGAPCSKGHFSDGKSEADFGCLAPDLIWHLFST